MVFDMFQDGVSHEDSELYPGCADVREREGDHQVLSYDFYLRVR